jgi:long-chain fatty acid transport protein
VPRLICQVAALACLLLSAGAAARPYAGISGLAATADSAETAGTNPAGIVRFDKRAYAVELMWFSSESEWESEFSGVDVEFNSKDSNDTLVPRIFLVEPLTDRLSASFTILGTAFSDDLGNWPGRYFITEYDSVFINAFPSLAWRIDERWSVAGSIAISYSTFEQKRAVRNIFDPGFPDGEAELDTDGVDFGFGLSTLFQASDRTRFGLTYQSEIEPDQDADSDYSGLGPRTERVFRELGVYDADISVERTSPQSMLAGVYHEFTNNHAVTLDVAWIDFSEFRLSEFYFDGNALAKNDTDYDDIYAASASYTWPVSQRWMLGVSGLVTNQMIDDDERTMTLRLDALWSVAVAAEWQWTENRRLNLSLAYLGLDDAPVTTPEIPGVGSLEGEFSRRDTLLFQLGLSWGDL